MIDLRIADALQGWITHTELEWLAKQAKKHKRIVEIGSYLGRSTRALGDNTDGVVYAIDNFMGPQDISIPAPIAKNVYEIFHYNLGTLINTGRVIPIIADHANVNVSISPDMVFLDGSHTYEAVKRDIEIWKARMTPGGLLCGHDYTNIGTVRQAVDELLKVKVARHTTIWYTKVN